MKDDKCKSCRHYSGWARDWCNKGNLNATYERASIMPTACGKDAKHWEKRK